jgi:hypothetical protein
LVERLPRSVLAYVSCRKADCELRRIQPDNSYEPILSQTIVASVDAVLEANTPSFLESIRLTTFTRELSTCMQSNRADAQLATKVCISSAGP